MTPESPQSPPALRIITPGTTPEEVAAIVAVLASMGGATEAPKPPHSNWAALEHRVRPIHRPGPGAWRNNALPH